MFLKRVINLLENLILKLRDYEEEGDEDEETEEFELEDAYYQPDNEVDEADIVSSLMEGWSDLYFHVKEHLPSLNEITSQHLAARFALQTTQDLDPALYMLASQVCEQEGYASPPPWALKIARATILEYLNGTLQMASTCMREHHQDVDEDHEAE